jgi:hypothetical protein
MQIVVNEQIGDRQGGPVDVIDHVITTSIAAPSAGSI